MMSFWQRVSRALFGSDHESQPISELYEMLNEAHAKLKVEDYSGAREILLKAAQFRPRIKDAPTTDWILGSLERTWLFQEQFDQQIEFFSNYVKRFPQDVSAYRARAAALWYSGRLNEAANDYSHAIDLNPLDILSRSARGQVLAELGENSKAMDDLNMALQLLATAPKPNQDWTEWNKHVEAFTRRGRAVAYAAQGEIRQAMNEFEASMTLSGDNAWLYFSRAQGRDYLADQSQALSEYRTAVLKKNPSLTPIQREKAHARIRELSGEP